MEDVLATYRGKRIASHAYVSRIEDDIVVLELRLTPTDFVPESEEKPKKWYDFLLKQKAKPTKRFRYPRKIVVVDLYEINQAIPEIQEKDVVVVEHIDGNIQSIGHRDEEETQKRIARAEERRARLKVKMR